MSQPLSQAELARRSEAVKRAPAHKALPDAELAELLRDTRAIPGPLPGRAVLQAEEKVPYGCPDLDQDAIFDVSEAPPKPFAERVQADIWVMTDEGLRRWRPFVDNFSVLCLPEGGRTIEYNNVRLHLTREQARHIARLLAE